LFFPIKPINASAYLKELPGNGVIDELEDWQWIHTPGHTSGHISLFREKDGVMVAGDAFVTSMQESLIGMITEKKIVCGPPKHFTPDYAAAAKSVKELAALEPNVISTGHGQAMYGEQARKELHKLSKEFWKQGIPAAGRYVKEAATFDEDGVPTYIPSAKGIMLKKIAVAAILFGVAYLISRQRKKSSGFVEKKLWDSLSKTFKIGALGAIGASAPASSAIPSIPLIPAI
jgi:glyoxylase-like metal-dependent hydrolase (beta-lactamase superfamily II)